MGEFSKKYQSLKSKKEISEIFSVGEKEKSGSVLMLYKSSENGTKVAFSVKKKDFKLAVDRNRIKRLMKEAFRLNQGELRKDQTLFFIHLGNEQHPFSYYNEKELLTRLNQDEL